MVRNVLQVTGYTNGDVNENTNVIICWTPDGAETASDTTKDTGGTGQAIRVASYLNIPVFNLQRPKRLPQLIEFIEELK